MAQKNESLKVDMQAAYDDCGCEGDDEAADYSKKAKKERTMVLLRRCERGLLPYHNSSTADLKRFADARGLRVPASANETDMISLLEEADDAATFDRFLELPPELRVRVYEFHIWSFSPVTTPVQPPISMASRLTREEALPLFYQNARFSFTAFTPLIPLDITITGFVRRLTEEHISSSTDSK